jgi:hypothetical protein
MSYVSGTVLGAFDAAAWDAYQERLTHGIDQGPPSGTLEDPNGGIIHFDANGQQDYYTPPATPLSDSTVEKNPASTFYGWTEYEKDALYAAENPNQNPTGIVTDYLRQRATFAPGSNVASYSATDEAESDRQLRAFAAGSAKIQAALTQLKTGAFRGAQQATFDATEHATKLANAQRTVDAWLAYRAPFVRQGQVLPLLPPFDQYLAGLDAETLQDVKDIVAKLPPDPKPATTTTPPVVSPGPPPPPPPPPPLPTLVPAATANYPPRIAPPAMPSDIKAGTTLPGPVAVQQLEPSSGFRVPWWGWLLGLGVAGAAVASTSRKRKR